MESNHDWGCLSCDEVEMYSEPVADWVLKLRADEENPKLSDLVLKCGDRAFKVHRCVLAAAMPFFDQMFHADMKDASAPEVNLSKSDPQKIVLPESLGLILQKVYGKPIPLNTENIYELHSAANFLGLEKLAEKCLEYMKTHISRSNAIKTWIYGDSTFLGAKLVFDEAQDFIRKNFGAISRQDDFLALKWGNVERLFRVDHLVVYYTNDLLNAAISWLNYDWSNRYHTAKSVLEAVNWANVDLGTTHLMDCMKAFDEQECTGEPERNVKMFILRKLIGPSLKHLAMEPEPVHERPAKRARCTDDEIEVCFGSENGTFFAYNVGQKKWSENSMPGLCLFGSNTSVIGAFTIHHQLFAITQQQDTKESPVTLYAMKKGKVFTIETSHELLVPKLSDFPSPVTVECILSSDSFLGLVVREPKFAILRYQANWGTAADPALKAIPCLEVIDDSHFLTKVMDSRPRYPYNLDACTANFVGSHFVWRVESFGVKNSGPLRLFDLKTSTFSLAPLPDPKKCNECFECAVYKGILYAFGFVLRSSLPVNAGPASASPLIRYLPLEDCSPHSKWQDLPPMGTGRFYPNVAFAKNKIYVFGGFGIGADTVKSAEVLNLGNPTAGWKVIAPFEFPRKMHNMYTFVM